MWNIKTKICIAIFAGERGHRTDALSVAVHPCGNVVASSGMDNSIKLWDLEAPDVKESMSKSYLHDDRAGNVSFVTHVQQFPIFSTDKVHKNYVDCVRWVGDLILSKSTCNRAVLWTPDPLRAKDAVCVLREFALTSSRLWFMKMSVCDALYIFAAGNTLGEVQLFHLTPPIADEEDARTAADNFLAEIQKANVDHEHERFETGIPCKSNATIFHESGMPNNIRDSDFSIDGKYFVYCAGTGVPSNQYSKVCVWRVETLEIHLPAEASSSLQEEAL
jgi:WD40 repeat protein